MSPGASRAAPYNMHPVGNAVFFFACSLPILNFDLITMCDLQCAGHCWDTSTIFIKPSSASHSSCHEWQLTWQAQASRIKSDAKEAIFDKANGVRQSDMQHSAY